MALGRREFLAGLGAAGAAAIAPGFGIRGSGFAAAQGTDAPPVRPFRIDTHSHFAVEGGVNETSLSVVPEVRVRDVVNGDDVQIYRALAGGVTTARLLHGSANCIGGQDAVVKMKFGRPAKEMLVADAPRGVKFALGENVKRSDGRFLLRGPGQCGRPGRFVSGDLQLVPERQCDLVPAIEEALAEKRVDFKGGPEFARRDTLIDQIDGDFHAWFLQGQVDQRADRGLRKLDWQQTAAEAVALEDVAERGRDDDSESRLQQ